MLFPELPPTFLVLIYKKLTFQKGCAYDKNHGICLRTKFNTMSFKKENILIGIFIFAGILLIYAFINNNFTVNKYSIGSTQGYDFNAPVTTIRLPKILHEISGLTTIDNSTIACVQDEDGIVFIYDWQKEEIIKELNFGKAGDYEGVTRVENSIFVLRSDGILFEIDNFKNEGFKVKKYDTGIPVKDSEGLVYDATRNRLLIAGKSKPKGDEYKNKKAVFAFDLNTKSIEKQPAYIFSEDNINQFVQENNSKPSEKDKEPDLKIHPSGIAVHPDTQKLFVLSSRSKMIYIFNQNSEVEAVHHLDKKIHTQPEGITFLDNGDMFISNEGGKGKPSLLRFPYKKH